MVWSWGVGPSEVGLGSWSSYWYRRVVVLALRQLVVLILDIGAAYGSGDVTMRMLVQAAGQEVFVMVLVFVLESLLVFSASTDRVLHS